MKLFPVILMACTIAQAAITEPLRIDSGMISGVSGTSPDVRVFKGIPYAQPPVGELRWHAPMPVIPWNGVRACDRFGPICVQNLPPAGSFYQQEYFTGEQPKMSEDCLYLNVWTAAKSAGQRRPVMLWIHGGGNVQGYGSEPCFDGEALAKKGVVLVTFNYRLNIFGLFAHPDLENESERHVSGNYQELDQIAALQWIQKNIAAFGGDPNRVTIFGQSSGGASVNRLLVCPLAKGLFQRVICQSAAILNSRDSKMSMADMEKRGVDFTAAMQANSLKELREKPAEEILAYMTAHKIRFDPVIDGYVLPELAVNVYDREGQFAVPMMLGSNSDEGQFVPIKADAFKQDSQKRFGDKMGEFLKLFPADTDEQAAQSKHDQRRDESFAGERWEARSQAKLGQPVYLYYFDRKPPGRDQSYGAFHAAELEYVFHTLEATDRPWEKVDRDLSEAMISYWTNFAAAGNPNGEGLPVWPAYDATKDACMELGDAIGARVVPDQSRLDFLEPFVHQDAR